MSSRPVGFRLNSFGTSEATIFKYSAGFSFRTVSMTATPCAAKWSFRAAINASEIFDLAPSGGRLGFRIVLAEIENRGAALFAVSALYHQLQILCCFEWFSSSNVSLPTKRPSRPFNPFCL